MRGRNETRPPERWVQFGFNGVLSYGSVTDQLEFESRPLRHFSFWIKGFGNSGVVADCP